MKNGNSKEMIYKVLPQIQGIMKALNNEKEWLYAVTESYVQVSGEFFVENFGFGDTDKICRPWGNKELHVEVEYAGLRIVSVVDDPDFVEDEGVEDEEESV